MGRKSTRHMVYAKGDENHLKAGKTVFSFILLTFALGLTGCGKQKYEYNAVKEDYLSAYDRDTIIMDNNGDILEISVDDYTDVTFDYSGLSDYIKKEVDDYNAKIGKNKINFLQYGQSDGIVKSAIKYNDFDSYNDFNNMDVKFTLYNEEYCNQIANEEFARKNAAMEAEKDEEDDEEVTDAELAEAGLTREEYEERKEQQRKEKEEGKAPEVVTATFTDAANGEIVDASVVNGKNAMMFTVPNAIDIKLDGGKFLYMNSHAAFLEDGTVRTDGNGTAIVVFIMSY